MTWALKDRSDVNRTFWERSPEEDSLLKFRIPLPSCQQTSHQNLLGAACLLACRPPRPPWPWACETVAVTCAPSSGGIAL